MFEAADWLCTAHVWHTDLLPPKAAATPRQSATTFVENIFGLLVRSACAPSTTTDVPVRQPSEAGLYMYDRARQLKWTH
jgi:hypothetical protein